MLTGLERCSVDSEISCGARKLPGHPGLPKKKKKLLGQPLACIVVCNLFSLDFLVFGLPVNEI
jgi:hypothetical protein